MTAFLWRLRTGRSFRARLLTPPSCRRPLHVAPDPERTRSSGSSGLRLRSRLAAGWTSGFSRGASWPPTNACPPSFPKSTTSSLNRGAPPTRLTSILLLPPPSPPLTALKRRDTSTCPHLDESVAAHLCPPMAIGWNARASHPSKPCRATSALDGRAYSAAGQEASALHSMAVLQVFRPRCSPARRPVSLRDLRSATDLALRATKATTQAIGRSMSSLVVLERHLWLTLTEMKEADKVPFLNAQVSSNSLFGPAVEGFAERFTEAQKSSQAMRHFLPKRASSAASSHPKPAPTQQPAKPKPATSEPLPPKGQQDRGRSRSARHYPKRQGSRPKIALDPAPQKSS